jgi:hypothetical protein
MEVWRRGRIPSNIVGEGLSNIVRVLGVAYSSDLRGGAIIEKIWEYRLP